MTANNRVAGDSAWTVQAVIGNTATIAHNTEAGRDILRGHPLMREDISGQTCTSANRGNGILYLHFPSALPTTGRMILPPLSPAWRSFSGSYLAAGTVAYTDAPQPAPVPYQTYSGPILVSALLSVYTSPGPQTARLPAPLTIGETWMILSACSGAGSIDVSDIAFAPVATIAAGTLVAFEWSGTVWAATVVA